MDDPEHGVERRVIAPDRDPGFRRDAPSRIHGIRIGDTMRIA